MTLHNTCIGKRSHESNVQVMTNRSSLIARFATVHPIFSLMKTNFVVFMDHVHHFV